MIAGATAEGAAAVAAGREGQRRTSVVALTSVFRDDRRRDVRADTAAAATTTTTGMQRPRVEVVSLDLGDSAAAALAPWAFKAR